jgi:hypothetical protein
LGFIDEVIDDIAESPVMSKRDRQILFRKRAKLKVFIRKISDDWTKHQKDSLSDTLIPRLYALMKHTKLTRLVSLNTLTKVTKLRADTGLISPQETYRWGIELSKFAPRISGTTNMDLTNKYIIEKLNSFGLNAWAEPMNFRAVLFKNFELRILSPETKEITCFPQNNVGFGDVTAKLIDVGKGEHDDYFGKEVEGQIVLVNWGTFRTHEGPCAARKRYTLLRMYDVAWAHKVAGMLGYFEDTPGNSLRVLEPGFKPVGGSNVWGPSEIGSDHQYQIPTLNIGREDAKYLRSLSNRGPIEVHMRIEGIRKVSTTEHVVGVLPGRTSKTLLVGSHTCTAFEGAICDTSGTVGNLALAKYFSQIPLGKRDKTLIFYFDSFHVWGNCPQAGLMFIKNHSNMIADIEALIWLDHIGAGETSARTAVVSENPVLWPLFLISMAKNGRQPLALPMAKIYTGCMPGPFARLGIPIVTQQAIVEALLSTEDTWDKFTPNDFFKDILIHVDLILWLQHITIPRDTPGESLGGCGVLFTESDTPDYPNGESYVPEVAPPLYVGGKDRSVRILKTQQEKDEYFKPLYTRTN